MTLILFCTLFCDYLYSQDAGARINKLKYFKQEQTSCLSESVVNFLYQRISDQSHQHLAPDQK